MTQTLTEYPIFEADQVLSQTHLNKLVGYLEEQDRLSRLYLHGMGIVCGLEVSKPNPNTVSISCGTALTSLGFLIPFEANHYTHYKDSIIAEDFHSADVSHHDYLENIYEMAGAYASLNPCIELLTNDSDDAEKTPLTAEILKNKIVMLLLESPLIDEKNCVTIDCADKGKRLELNVRVLVIDIDLLEKLQFNLSNCSSGYLAKLKLPRFNVPSTDLSSGNIVMQAFNTVIQQSKSFLTKTIEAIHNNFEPLYGSLDNYSRLKDTAPIINSIHEQYQGTIHLQYLYDWLKDLAETCNEISEFNACQLSICCPEENDFPFHVLLGSAELATTTINNNHNLYNYRTHFIKTGADSVVEKQKQDLLKGLLQKLIQLLGSFKVTNATARENGIKITPSNNGLAPLSKRAIPYYYADIPNIVDYWSPELTQKVLNDKILSYHSELYNSTDQHVNQPLLHDLGCFDFFRIEGHIGQPYAEAITEIVALQEDYRLPFKTVALNAADHVGKDIDISNQSGIWDDMELDYDLAKEKVFNITEYVITWIKSKKTSIQEHYSLMNDQTINNLESILKESRDLLVEDLKDFIPNYPGFYEVFEDLNELFLMHRLCISAINPNEMHPIMEDLIDHFDEINNLFLEDPFTIIHEEVQRRWENSVKELFLSNFLKKHPGIDHNAGVPKGGTFILVYVDNSIFQKSEKGNNNTLLLERIKNYKTLFDFNDDQKDRIKKNNVVRKRAILKGRVNKKEESVEWLDEKQKLRVQLKDSISNDIMKYPYASRKLLENQLNSIFDKNFGRLRLAENTASDFNLPEKVIIADFYLPYVCCGNGDNINIIINQETSKEPIVADFDHNDFDDNDFFTNVDTN